MLWFVWLLFTFGLVYFGVAASIAEVPRRALYSTLGRFGAPGKQVRGVLACGPCFAFWVGAFVGLPDTAPVATFLPWGWSGWIVEHAIAAFVVMGFVSIIQYFSGIAISHIAREEAYRDSYEAKLEQEEAQRKRDFERFKERATLAREYVIQLWSMLAVDYDIEPLGDCCRHKDN